MRPSVRTCFSGEGYVYATRAEVIARRCGHTNPARLASNENPFSLPEHVLARGMEALKLANRYPPERHERLLEALRGASAWDRIVVNNGMDGVIETVIRSLVEPGDRIAIASPTFSFYAIAARAFSAEIALAPRRHDFSVDRERLAEMAEGAKITFLCSPNNPTGTVTPPGDVEWLLDATGGLVFLDNAYVEFSDEDYRPLMEDHENLVIGRTMSKAYSMAGLRFGYALIPEWLEPVYERAATPFAVNLVTAAVAEAAIREKGHVERSVRHVRMWRERFRREIEHPTLPSGANFVLVDVSPFKGDEAMERLASRGVIVRSCASFPGLEDHYIRVSVGADWENELFLKEINSL
ncbi:MAG: histidinol-phosphate transaminase [Methanomicrobiales archaeon]|nr:histidinol-phosphate transaminase [Methanomicrobiales archaeon]